MPKSSSSRTSLLPQLSPAKNRAAWVGVSLTAIGMLVAAVLYVTTALADTKVWAAEEDQATQSVIRTELKEDYVNKVEYTKDITILDERQQTIKKDVGEIKTLIKEVRDDIRSEHERPRYGRRYERHDDPR
jgi:gas vesicle protein